MANHFSAIGFVVRNKDDYQSLINTVLQQGEVVEVPSGYYIILKHTSGIQLYVQANKERSITGVNPHFEGAGAFKAGVTQLIEVQDYPLDGRVKAWANPPDDQFEDGEFPFTFDVPNYRIMESDINAGDIRMVQLAAFSHEFKLFGSEEQYFDDQDKELKMAAESFIPGEILGDESRMTEAFFTGRILSYEQIVNPFSQQDFCYLQVKTLGGIIDVVADSKMLNKEPSVDGIIQGTFWLSGIMKSKSSNG